ncbi:Transcriptional regulatory protein Sin3-like protein, partial [Aduncisulcus paluster]
MSKEKGSDGVNSNPQVFLGKLKEELPKDDYLTFLNSMIDYRERKLVDADIVRIVFEILTPKIYLLREMNKYLQPQYHFTPEGFFSSHVLNSKDRHGKPFLASVSKVAMRKFYFHHAKSITPKKSTPEASIEKEEASHVNPDTIEATVIPTALSLPPVQQISTSSNENKDKAKSFIEHVSEQMNSDTPLYTAFLSVLCGYQKRQFRTQRVCATISLLFHDKPQLLAEFAYFLPPIWCDFVVDHYRWPDGWPDRRGRTNAVITKEVISNLDITFLIDDQDLGTPYSMLKKRVINEKDRMCTYDKSITTISAIDHRQKVTQLFRDVSDSLRDVPELYNYFLRFVHLLTLNVLSLDHFIKCISPLLKAPQTPKAETTLRSLFLMLKDAKRQKRRRGETRHATVQALALDERPSIKKKPQNITLFAPQTPKAETTLRSLFLMLKDAKRQKRRRGETRHATVQALALDERPSIKKKRKEHPKRGKRTVSAAVLSESEEEEEEELERKEEEELDEEWRGRSADAWEEGEFKSERGRRGRGRRPTRGRIPRAQRIRSGSGASSVYPAPESVSSAVVSEMPPASPAEHPPSLTHPPVGLVPPVSAPYFSGPMFETTQHAPSQDQKEEEEEEAVACAGSGYRLSQLFSNYISTLSQQQIDMIEKEALCGHGIDSLFIPSINIPNSEVAFAYEAVSDPTPRSFTHIVCPPVPSTQTWDRDGSSYRVIPPTVSEMGFTIDNFRGRRSVRNFKPGHISDASMLDHFTPQEISTGTHDKSFTHIVCPPVPSTQTWDRDGSSYRVIPPTVSEMGFTIDNFRGRRSVRNFKPGHISDASMLDHFTPQEISTGTHDKFFACTPRHPSFQKIIDTTINKTLVSIPYGCEGKVKSTLPDIEEGSEGEEVVVTQAQSGLKLRSRPYAGSTEEERKLLIQEDQRLELSTLELRFLRCIEIIRTWIIIHFGTDFLPPNDPFFVSDTINSRSKEVSIAAQKYASMPHSVQGSSQAPMNSGCGIIGKDPLLSRFTSVEFPPSFLSFGFVSECQKLAREESVIIALSVEMAKEDALEAPITFEEQERRHIELKLREKKEKEEREKKEEEEKVDLPQKKEGKKKKGEKTSVVVKPEIKAIIPPKVSVKFEGDVNSSVSIPIPQEVTSTIPADTASIKKEEEEEEEEKESKEKKEEEKEEEQSSCRAPLLVSQAYDNFRTDDLSIFAPSTSNMQDGNVPPSKSFGTDAPCQSYIADAEDSKQETHTVLYSLQNLFLPNEFQHLVRSWSDTPHGKLKENELSVFPAIPLRQIHLRHICHMFGKDSTGPEVVSNLWNKPSTTAPIVLRRLYVELNRLREAKAALDNPGGQWRSVNISNFSRSLDVAGQMFHSFDVKKVLCVENFDRDTEYRVEAARRRRERVRRRAEREHEEEEHRRAHDDSNVSTAKSATGKKPKPYPSSNVSLGSSNLGYVSASPDQTPFDTDTQMTPLGTHTADNDIFGATVAGLSSVPTNLPPNLPLPSQPSHAHLTPKFTETVPSHPPVVSQFLTMYPQLDEVQLSIAPYPPSLLLHVPAGDPLRLESNGEEVCRWRGINWKDTPPAVALNHTLTAPHDRKTVELALKRALFGCLSVCAGVNNLYGILGRVYGLLEHLERHGYTFDLQSIPTNAILQKDVCKREKRRVDKLGHDGGPKRRYGRGRRRGRSQT